MLTDGLAALMTDVEEGRRGPGFSTEIYAGQTISSTTICQFSS